LSSLLVVASIQAALATLNAATGAVLTVYALIMMLSAATATGGF
jgi:hypothetical protein